MNRNIQCTLMKKWQKFTVVALHTHNANITNNNSYSTGATISTRNNCWHYIPRGNFRILFNDHKLPVSKGSSFILIFVNEAIATRQALNWYSFPYCTFVLAWWTLSVSKAVKHHIGIVHATVSTHNAPSARQCCMAHKVLYWKILDICDLFANVHVTMFVTCHCVYFFKSVTVS